jgi:hypothetical protein
MAAKKTKKKVRKTPKTSGKTVKAKKTSRKPAVKKAATTPPAWQTFGAPITLTEPSGHLLLHFVSDMYRSLAISHVTGVDTPFMKEFQKAPDKVLSFYGLTDLEKCTLWTWDRKGLIASAVQQNIIDVDPYGQFQSMWPIPKRGILQSETSLPNFGLPRSTSALITLTVAGERILTQAAPVTYFLVPVGAGPTLPGTFVSATGLVKAQELKVSFDTTGLAIGAQYKFVLRDSACSAVLPLQDLTSPSTFTVV